MWALVDDNQKRF
ncbi:hypothetical protein VCHC40A1_0398, partial [Vibrio cholerae HC-40A1]